MKVIRKALEFEWDHGNKGKNFRKHNVTDEECEEVFFDAGKRALRNVLHSQSEERYVLLGKTRGERLLFVVYALRGSKIRVISARDVTKKENREENTSDPKI